MNKVIRNGKVAVITSKQYGPWSTVYGEDVLFDPNLVEIIESGENIEGRVQEYCMERYPDEYWDIIPLLEIQWIPLGTYFKVFRNYDEEYIEYAAEIRWEKA